MDLTDLSSLIKALRPSFRSPEQQQLDTIVNAWRITLGTQIAQNSGPIRYERNSLTIAVRQAIWSQQLTAQTHQILQQLRPHLPPQLTIKTLRFRVAPDLCLASTQQPPQLIPPADPPHPSRWPIPPFQSGTPTPVVHLNPTNLNNPNLNNPNLKTNTPRDDFPVMATDPPAQSPNPSLKLQQTVDRWKSNLDRHAPHLQSCPRCHCLTPPAELDRWQMCALCATSLFQPSMPLGGQRPAFQNEPTT